MLFLFAETRLHNLYIHVLSHSNWTGFFEEAENRAPTEEELAGLITNTEAFYSTLFMAEYGGDFLVFDFVCKCPINSVSIFSGRVWWLTVFFCFVLLYSE